MWKDKSGKTQVHSKSCKNLGKHYIQTCSCPVRLASGTVDNIIHQLIDIFDMSGRGRDWNSSLGVGNPAASDTVKLYLKAIKEEQARAHVVPKQAKPIFIDKIRSITQYINR